MLTIRRDQFASFAEAREAEFARRLAGHLAPKFAGSPGMDDPDRFARESIAEARGHGLTTERNIAAYAEVRATLGPGFDADPATPWAGKILRRRDLDEDEAMDLLGESLIFESGGPR